MSEYIDTKYECTKCGAEDSDHSTHPPTALTCWQCGAGRNVDIPNMVRGKVGMHPVEQKPADMEVAN